MTQVQVLPPLGRLLFRVPVNAVDARQVQGQLGAHQEDHGRAGALRYACRPPQALMMAVGHVKVEGSEGKGALLASYQCLLTPNPTSP